MGYTTDFTGCFTLDKPLTEAQAAYLHRFSGSRRMRRDPSIAAKFHDPLRAAVGLPIGEEGGYFVGTEEGDKEPYLPGDQRHVTAERYAKVSGMPLDAAAGWAKEENAGPNWAGQRRDASVIDGNEPPAGQPGLWCQWVPSDSRASIEWNGGEKFYDYVEWLEYLIAHFLQPWGYTLNGEVEWQGEDSADFGKIVVTNNAVQTKKWRR